LLTVVLEYACSVVKFKKSRIKGMLAAATRGDTLLASIRCGTSGKSIVRWVLSKDGIGSDTHGIGFG